MTATVIIDGIVAAVLLGFMLMGGRRGLFRSVAGLAALIAALVIAGAAAERVTPLAAEWLQPVIERRVAARVDAALGDVTPTEPQVPDGAGDPGEADGLDLDGLLALLGIGGDDAGELAQRAREKARETGVDLATAVVQSVAASVLHKVVFLLTFLVSLAALKLVIRMIDLALKLPGLHGLNALGGAAVGLVEGAIALLLALWLLRRFGVTIDAALAEQTHLLRWFMTPAPFAALSI